MSGSVPASVAAQTTPPAAETTAPIATPAAAPTPGGAPLVPPATLALDVRDVRARRTADGYVLTAEALVNDPCQAARFDASPQKIDPPQFDLDQFRSPKKTDMLCIQVLAWVTAQPRTVTSAKPPAYVTVRSKDGTVRVPVR